FVNAPTTPEIYTLSLHDALPISTEVARVYNTIEYKDWVQLTAAQSELSLEVRKPTADLLTHTRKVLARGADEDPLHHPLERTYADRKSTRLNSSHVKISYAVFCL